MTDKERADALTEVVNRHADKIDMSLLRDLAKALRLRVRVNLVEPSEK